MSTGFQYVYISDVRGDRCSMSLAWLPRVSPGERSSTWPRKPLYYDEKEPQVVAMTGTLLLLLLSLESSLVSRHKPRLGCLVREPITKVHLLCDHQQSWAERIKDIVILEESNSNCPHARRRAYICTLCNALPEGLQG